MRKLTVVLLPTLTTPDCTTVDAPFGPVTVQLTVLICSPPGSVSCMPTVPTLSDEPCCVPCGSALVSPSAAPGDEQPICAPAMVATPAALAIRRLRTRI